MKICKLCPNEIPNRVKIDGVIRSLQNRKYCLVCSPYKAHNTKQLHATQFRCKCGAQGDDKYYGNRRETCIECHNKKVNIRLKRNRDRSIDFLGGKCIICDYSRYSGALDIHHTNPDIKDANFARYRGWSWERIEKELMNCVLLCKVCHAEHHGGIIDLPHNHGSVAKIGVAPDS